MGKTSTRSFFLVMALASLAGCKRTQTEAAPTAAPASASVAERNAPPPVVADAAPVDQRVAATRSVASFEKDRLDECVDMTLIFPPGSDAAKVEKTLDERMKLEKGQVRVSSSCAEQFADRPPLATCLITKKEARDGGGSVAAVIEAFYYSVKTASDSDGYMRDCLEGGGTWTPAKKDDAAAARERVRQRAKALQDLADKLPQE